MDFGLAATLSIAALVLISILSSVVSFRLGAPLLLIFLLVGLLAGEDGPGRINFDDGPLAYLIGSLALAIILFDSGFATPLRSYRANARPALAMATAGVVVTGVLAGLVAHRLLPLTWPESMLLGAALSSTDAAAVFFLVRAGGLRMRERVRSILEIESGTNDPVAIMLIVALTTLVKTGEQHDAVALVLSLVQQFGLGIGIGLLGGRAVVWLVNAFDMESALYPLIALAAALCVYSGAVLVGGSGFLAVYLAGLIAGNLPLKAKYGMRRFQSAMTWLSQIVMFLTLGLLATPSQFGAALLPALLLAVALTFVVRPLATVVCLAPFRLPAREVGFIGWVGLRGAVSILLAIVPLLIGTSHASTIFNVAFLVVVFSLLLQGWTIGPVARLLGLVEGGQATLVDRLELELPGRSAHDLVGYRLGPNSPALKDGRFPRWARPSLVVRDGQSMRLHQAGPLRAGDLVYLFCLDRHIKLLDRIYAGSSGGDERALFGDFSLAPETELDGLAARYRLTLPHDLVGKTAKEALLLRLQGNVELGDRIPLGPYELIVRDINENGDIVEIGLLLDDPDAAWR